MPEGILAAAPADPFAIPPGLFLPQHQRCSEPALALALEALGSAGSVLDVGCGAGAASLALVPPARSITGVDLSAAMLEQFEAGARQKGIEHAVVRGTWPDAADRVGRHTVVIAHHLVYNVSEIERFLVELTTHATARVVMEVTRVHPQAPLAPLWAYFHGIDRPTGPTLADLLDIVRDLGLDPDVQMASRPPPVVPMDRRLLVRFTRARLCLPASADEAIDELLPVGYSVPPREVACLSWTGAGTTTDPAGADGTNDPG